MKQKKAIIFLIVTIMLALSIPIFAAPNPADHVFNETLPSVLGFYAFTPQRINNGQTQVFCQIISKLNQPRNSGTNPHGGMDLQMEAGTPVYPLAKGTVVHIKKDSVTMNQQLGTVWINHNGIIVLYRHIII
jgi:murein DD-endopeptidase MepM/ murein hydrolase activator NlpD